MLSYGRLCTGIAVLCSIGHGETAHAAMTSDRLDGPEVMVSGRRRRPMPRGFVRAVVGHALLLPVIRDVHPVGEVGDKGDETVELVVAGGTAAGAINTK